jgi:hypothetical protein
MMQLKVLDRINRIDRIENMRSMQYISKYKTPDRFDDLVMCGDGEVLTGLWFEGSRDDWRNTHGCERRETPVFRDTRRWLDEYFAGHDPGFTPNYRIRVQKKLLEKFESWIDADPDFGSGTGEAAWLGAFLAKWMREGEFPYDRLESLVRWHLARQAPKLLDEFHGGVVQ